MAPERVSKTLLEAISVLARDLRAAGVDSSSAEAIDGIRAVEHVGVGERRLVRAALQATLVKRTEDLGVFDVLFDRHFPLSPPPAAAAAPTDGPVIDGHDVAPASFAVGAMT